MYTGRKIKFYIFFSFSWKYLVFFFLFSSLVFELHSIAGFKFIEISFLPIGLIGTAVAFYIGFKNNSAYDRLWEARKIWGRLINNSRNWGISISNFVRQDLLKETSEDALKNIKKELVNRHLAFVYALKNQLRSRTVWDEMTGNKLVNNIAFFKAEKLEVELASFLPKEEINLVAKFNNPAFHIIKKQAERLDELNKQGNIAEFQYLNMMKLLTDMLEEQGGCERLKTFPLPRQYAFFSQVFVWIFICLLPFGMIGEFQRMNAHSTWLMIPFYMLIAWIFITMEMIGDNSENPFENALNDIPMSAICRIIEIDLYEMLGDTNLPPKLQPINHILM